MGQCGNPEAFVDEDERTRVIDLKLQMLDACVSLLQNLHLIQSSSDLKGFMKKKASQETFTSIAKASQQAEKWLTGILEKEDEKVARRAQAYHSEIIGPFYKEVMSRVDDVRQKAQSAVEDSLATSTKHLQDCLDNPWCAWKASDSNRDATWEQVKDRGSCILKLATAQKITECFDKLVKETSH